MNSINHITEPQHKNISKIAIKSLNLSATLWFLVAVAGQWLFAYYIALFYGGTAIKGDWESWTKRMIHGIIEGDLIGNIAVMLHILLAFIITFGGPLQLIPQLRKRIPVFHRWNGRIYIATAVLISLGALYMVWTREALVGGLYGQIAISGNALLIIVFAVITIRTAINHNLKAHRRWALRTFMVVSGVWFFRIGFGLWIFLNNGSAPGSTEDLTGVFDKFLYYADYLLPLLFLELYLRAKDITNSYGKFIMTGVTFILTILTGIGIFMAAQIFWLSHL
ncbi:DUF2306 domain-containing protein [Aquimarina sp. 2201CG5-10]|uniref:DUF2306 domain-containing protein n=1 Tax=Aquimarina callyspongiae TaxID=3098150 RepID=UPI002AB49FA1|nr:DUF2306 domain-containing protein [Aquimarina sp. 2201CG5-10]MDY8135636.1 DUF2306 domain-containing protein [Aquimarina sp. 2201CG5-10]